MNRKTIRTKQSKRPSNGKPKAEVIKQTIDELGQLSAPSAKAQRAIAMFQEWLSDQSGYDEKTWPKLKKALNERRIRVGARRLFDV